MKNQFLQTDKPSLTARPRGNMQPVLIFLLALVLLCAACGGRETTASSMKLAAAEGTVHIRDEKEKNLDPAADMNLYSGYQMDTREASYAWLNLDSARLAKMDQTSALEIQKSGKDLELLLQSGNLYFNVEKPLEDDESMDIRTSSLTVGIRGTCGWVENMGSGQIKVYILEGKVQCSLEVPGAEDDVREEVSSGEMALVDPEKGEIQVKPFPEEDIPPFVLKELSEDDLDTFRPYLAAEESTDDGTGTEKPSSASSTAAGEETAAEMTSGEETAPEESTARIAAQALGAVEGTEETFTFRYLSTGENYTYGLSGDPGQQLLAADRYDYDGDGADEILAFVLEGDTGQGFFVYIAMLEKEGDSWIPAAFLEPEDPYSGARLPGMELDAIACPERIDFFTRTTENGEVWLMLEDAGLARRFADGFSWGLSAYRYQDHAWQTAHEGRSIAGSAGLDPYLRMDPLAAAEFGEDTQYVQEFVDGVHEMGVYPTKELAIENPVMDDDPGLRKLLRLQKEDQFEAEDYSRLAAGEPAGLVTVTATDFCGE